MLTREEVEEREDLRRRVLATMYEVANGSHLAVINLEPLADHLHVERGRVLDAARYLSGRGLLSLYSGATATLTQAGIDEAEASTKPPERAQQLPPAVVINQTITGPVGTGIQTGGVNLASQSIGPSLGEVASLIMAVREALPAEAIEAREALAELQHEATAATPKPCASRRSGLRFGA